MMTNIFSMFDPSSSLMNFQLKWLNALLILFFFPYSYWLSPSPIQFMWITILKKINQEIKILTNHLSFTGINIFFSTLFFFLLFNNFLGLFPYIFTSSSHLTLNLSISLTIWISLMFYGWFNMTNNMFSHLIPNNTPPILMPFMVLIETISNVIRPLTLAVRLSANMIAGHLLIFLLMNNPCNFITFNILIMAEIILMLLEMSVSIIQAYVFTILSTLYTSEIN
uniref:ATP synthase F0 subunit 6 n=1 Tax=Macrostemum radiatum TaxID=1875683 RepID=UPI0022381D99|nr:ATP synthase F0 subunit 6 [Macrostemum radiatum]UYO79400.1 ATP synthase F0 subunit 6 [Macrostemum radiatum]